MEGVIYMYTSPSNKVYIGQTLNEKGRKLSHKAKAKKFEEAYFSRAINKYGFDNFEYTVLHTASGKQKKK